MLTFVAERCSATKSSESESTATHSRRLETERRRHVRRPMTASQNKVISKLHELSLLPHVLRQNHTETVEVVAMATIPGMRIQLRR